ncbi:ribulose bisphosphate carboxylase small chain 1, chloroplastic-like [Camellia sinensis]|uniref:ribulose bisphosphate carboxylase small chain 1, chloroplastic-like n=1 Tax=Camellia sinensis TaxID=4442 RepID=UPI00103640D2|nr:ribulose bisphosphate carboxylase small chain 1, chloroplastic-like [Camellia sinensis]
MTIPVWPPLGLKKFGTLSYLPPLCLVQLGKEVDYLICQAWIPCLEFSVEIAFAWVIVEIYFCVRRAFVLYIENIYFCRILCFGNSGFLYVIFNLDGLYLVGMNLYDIWNKMLQAGSALGIGLPGHGLGPLTIDPKKEPLIL